MADDAETPTQQYVRRAAENRGIDIDRARKAQGAPSAFQRALGAHGTAEDMVRSMRLLAAQDTESDRTALRALFTLTLAEDHPDATEAELDEAARKLLTHLRGVGIKRAS